LLGLELRVVGGWLRVINPITGKPYLSPREQQTQLRAAERRAWREAQARKNAEAARQAAEDLAQREVAARQAAEERAQREEAARQAAEARLHATDAALRAALAELARLRGDSPPEE
jgi:hypothetical protein